MTALSNVTASANENENAVSRDVQMWLSGIVEAFDDRSGKSPISVPASSALFQLALT